MINSDRCLILKTLSSLGFLVTTNSAHSITSQTVSFPPALLTPLLPALKCQGSMELFLSRLFSHIPLNLDDFSSSVAPIAFSMGMQFLTYGYKFFTTPILSKHWDSQIMLSAQGILNSLIFTSYHFQELKTECFPQIMSQQNCYQTLNATFLSLNDIEVVTKLSTRSNRQSLFKKVCAQGSRPGKRRRAPREFLWMAYVGAWGWGRAWESGWGHLSGDHLLAEVGPGQSQDVPHGQWPAKGPVN